MNGMNDIEFTLAVLAKIAENFWPVILVGTLSLIVLHFMENKRK
jgi:hypothetical protein